MSQLPLCLEVGDVDVRVVSGGAGAERKVRALLGAGARVTILSPLLDDALARRVAAGEVHHRAEAFRAALEPDPYRLVIAAAGPALNGQVAAWARRHRLWIDAVDDPAHCTALWPAVVDRGALKVAIGSAGAAPVLARRIRARPEQLLPERLGDLVALAGRFLQHRHARFSVLQTL